MSKRILVLLMVLSIGLLGFAGCAKKEKAPEAQPQQTAPADTAKTDTTTAVK